MQHGTIFLVFLNRQPCKAKRPGDGEVIALSTGTKKLRWRRHIGASETSPVVIGNRVYVGDWLGKVYALDKRSGAIVWTARTGGAVKGAVAVSGNRVYAGSYDGHVYAFDARNGHRLWRASGQPRLFGAGRFYSDSRRRVWARLHRIDGRQGVFVRRNERQAPLVPQHRRLRLRVTGDLASARSHRVL